MLCEFRLQIETVKNRHSEHRITHCCSRCWVNEVRPVSCSPQSETHLLCPAHKLQLGQSHSHQLLQTLKSVMGNTRGLTLLSSWSLSSSVSLSSDRPLVCVTVTTVMETVGAEGNNCSRSETQRRTYVNKANYNSFHL